MAPVAVYGCQLKKEDLFELVRLVVSFTHTHQQVIEVCYLYCFAITRIMNGSKKVYEETKKEANDRAQITGFTDIKYWFSN